MAHSLAKVGEFVPLFGHVALLLYVGIVLLSQNSGLCYHRPFFIGNYANSWRCRYHDVVVVMESDCLGGFCLLVLVGTIIVLMVLVFG